MKTIYIQVINKLSGRFYFVYRNLASRLSLNVNSFRRGPRTCPDAMQVETSIENNQLQNREIRTKCVSAMKVKFEGMIFE